MKLSRIIAIVASVVILVLCFIFWRRDAEMPTFLAARPELPKHPAAIGSPSDSRPVIIDRPAATASVAPPEPVSRLGQIAPVIAVDGWKNAGRASVGAAIQSQFWAIARGDVEYLQRSIVFDEPARRSLENLSEQVPASVRTQYPTPEALAAFLLTSRPALKGYALSLENVTSADDVSVHVMTLLPGADRFTGERQDFRRGVDGQWSRAIGPREISYWRDMVKWDKELSRSRKWSQ
jgi:hypothetical protein